LGSHYSYSHNVARVVHNVMPKVVQQTTQIFLHGNVNHSCHQTRLHTIIDV